MFKENIKAKVYKVSAVGSALAGTALSVVSAHAEGETGATTNSKLISSLVTGFQSTTNDALDGISQIAPIALPIIGAIVVVTLGIKIFKRVGRG